MKELYQIFLHSSGVSIDTRNLAGGELFFCLKGEVFNGNKFAQKALDQGASFVVVDDPEFFQSGKPMLLVGNSLFSLQSLAKYHREKLDIPLIGITGTNGKTTTKELIASVLSSHYFTLFTSGNFNNHIGVPLTLLRIKKEHKIAIIEMGANHPGEIADLCELSQPSFGVITNIGKAHLEGFGSYENIKQTKLALYRSVKQINGLFFVNADDAMLMENLTHLPLITYSQFSESDFKLILENSSEFLSFSWKDHNIKTRLFGDYNIYNAGAAIAIGSYFQVPDEKIVKALEEYTPSNNRSQVEIGPNNQLILDAYNANPDSVHNALQYFSQNLAENKVVILGDMLELGEFEATEHKSILDLLKNMNFTKVFLIGEAYYSFNDYASEFHFFKNNTDALNYFSENPINDSIILLKGSRGIRLETLKEALL